MLAAVVPVWAIGAKQVYYDFIPICYVWLPVVQAGVFYVQVIESITKSFE